MFRAAVLTMAMFPAWSWAQVGQTVTWVGGNAYQGYGTPGNWNTGVVPENNPGTNFTLIIPPNLSLTYDLDRSATVSSMNLQDRSGLRVASNRSFGVGGVAVIGGPVEAIGPGSEFLAGAPTVSLGPLSTLAAIDGGRVQLGASGYQFVGDYRGHLTLFRASGQGSYLDLSAMQSVEVPGAWGGRWVYSITADGDAVIDLSSLGTVLGARTDAYDNEDWLEFNLLNGGQIKLDGLLQSSRRVRFNVSVPHWEMRALSTVGYETDFNLGPQTRLGLPALTSGSGVDFNLAEGAQIDAPNLSRLDGAALNLGTNTVFTSTNLVRFTSSYLQLSPGRTLVAPPFREIDRSFLLVHGGATLRVAATSYQFIPDYRGHNSFFRATGTGSLLDLRSLQSIEVPGAWGGAFAHAVTADDGGIVDLGGLGTAIGARFDAYDNEDWLDFNIGSGGDIRLGNLQTASRRVRFNISTPQYELPALQSCDWTAFNLAQDTALSLPSLVTFAGSFGLDIGSKIVAPKLESIGPATLTVPFAASLDLPLVSAAAGVNLNVGVGGVINAPSLETFTSGSLSLSPGRTLVAPVFREIDRSFLSVSGGSSLRVDDERYEFYPDYRAHASFFSANGAGSSLDLSTMKRLEVFGAWGGGWSHAVTADNNAVIDLSGLEVAVGARSDAYDNEDFLDFNLSNGGLIRLDNLRESVRRVRFNLSIPSWRLPRLTNVSYRTEFNVAGSSFLDLPALATGSGVGFSLAESATVSAPELRSLDGSSIGLEVGATFNASNLVDFTTGYLQAGAGRTINIPPLRRVDRSFLIVSGGATLRSVDTDYDYYPDYRAHTSFFAASGAGSRLDLSALERIETYGAWGGAWSHSVAADNNGFIDLSSLRTAVGARTDAYDNEDWLDFVVRSGGTIRLGAVTLERRARVIANGALSTIEAAGIRVSAPANISFSGKARLRLKDSFTHNLSDPNAMALDDAVIQFEGSRNATLEVAGRDAGPAGASAGNFNLGQLVVGGTNAGAVVRLVDEISNGRRGGVGEPESLYLSGIDGVGLRILPGSTLVLGNINAYAMNNGQMVHLNALIPAGSNSVRFDQGIIATTGGPAITQMVPRGRLSPPLSSVDLSFDVAISPDSLDGSDISISGPAGPISASSVVSVGGNTWRVAFAPQTADGAYVVAIGPNISDRAGLLTTMDQDRDGMAGEPLEDQFRGVLVIDSTAPSAVSAFALQGGTQVGVTFDETVDPAWATNAGSYLVNGSASTHAQIRSNGTQVVLTVNPLVGDAFSLEVKAARDSLGNVSDRALTGRITSLASTDIGSPGSDPREIGSALTFDGAAFENLGGGSAIWGGYDAHHYAFEARSGDFDVRVQVADVTRYGTYIDAGLMFRESLVPTDRKVQATIEQGPSGASFYYLGVRPSAGAGVSSPYPHLPGVDTANSGFPNAWVRLRRTGNIFSAFRSTNGLDWIEYGRSSNALPSAGYLGLVTCSSDNGAGRYCVANYRNYSEISPAILSQPQSQFVRSGAEANFEVTARGLPALTYQWFFNGETILGATNANYLLAAVTTNHVGEYWVVVSNAYGAVTSDFAKLVVDDISNGGSEADLSPAPFGNNTVSVADWVKVGRLVAGLDRTQTSSEFMRADCAPRTNAVLGTFPRGNGVLTVADWTQAGRYAAGLDPITPTGGPSGGGGGGGGGSNREGAVAEFPATLDLAGRQLRLGSGKGAAGDSVLVPVQLTGVGDENALGFTVGFDPQTLRFEAARLRAGAEGGTLHVNSARVMSGLVGIALAQPTGTSLPGGTTTIAELRFRAIRRAPNAALLWSDALVSREVSSVSAEALTADWAAGAVSVVAAGQLSLARLTDGAELRLTGESGERYQVEASDDLRQWTSVATVTATEGATTVADPGGVGAAQRFYRARWVQ